MAWYEQPSTPSLDVGTAVLGAGSVAALALGFSASPLALTALLVLFVALQLAALYDTRPPEPRWFSRRSRRMLWNLMSDLILFILIYRYV